MRALFGRNPANIYLFNVNNRNTRKRCEICSKLTIQTPERRQTLFLLLTYFTYFSSASIINFEQVNASWEVARFFCVLVYTYFFPEIVFLFD